MPNGFASITEAAAVPSSPIRVGIFVVPVNWDAVPSERTESEGLFRPDVAGGVGLACKEEKLGLGDDGLRKEV